MKWILILVKHAERPYYIFNLKKSSFLLANNNTNFSVCFCIYFNAFQRSQFRLNKFFRVRNGNYRSPFFLIDSLKLLKEDFSFISSGTIPHIFDPRYEMLSVPLCTMLSKRNSKFVLVSESITSIISFPKNITNNFWRQFILILIFSVAKFCIFLWCIETDLSLIRGSL